MRRVFTLIVAGLLAGCSFELPSNAPVARRLANTSNGVFRLELSRQGCFGPCPQYDLVVSHDGSAVLTTKRFMAFAGSGVGHMRVEYLRKLVRAADFQALACTTRIPDAELVRLSVVDGSTEHTVECSLGGGDTAQLMHLVEGIHQAILATRWERRSPN